MEISKNQDNLKLKRLRNFRKIEITEILMLKTTEQFQVYRALFFSGEQNTYIFNICFTPRRSYQKKYPYAADMDYTGVIGGVRELLQFV